ncbi:C40 family peptidase [Acidithiobacillus sp. CV18-2]|uniref:C40 family peptidase n=2 Tax=Igneacidithiobacillus copahuensis TaxID=2724909 RepID=A0AAE3CKG4_9PROT|nr:C40 family peptidase [Acidithiobacillus sp. CV18-3]MBU2758410.1 C40 family peptidase [Acidithiobacillus sp. BN09-2]MBU2776710.1 C40 family peptidase [Acidithiobacillus sp. CV18-2]MBU2788781.1 C40 family peptidase [Igneacidithiobacillus copahuensis]MBU2795692.1 C40 family peptidase [Acidithiobacillus sp. VAN18-2]MBU2799003.1 C40 family peptidase [Acidithiobacillus sp. VAN18-4]
MQRRFQGVWRNAMRRSLLGVAVTLAVFFSGTVMAQAHTKPRHHEVGKRTHAVTYHHKARPVLHRQRHVDESSVYRDTLDTQPASFDSLAPSALQLMHLSPVPFAGVGAAPQANPLPHYSFSRPIPDEVHPVDSAHFINAALILDKVADNAPVAAAPAVKASEAVAVTPATENTVSSRPSGTLGVALQMLASQAYYWASHPLEALQQEGDFAAGDNARSELRNDVALAAQDATAEAVPDNGSWLSPHGLVSAALRFIGAPYVWGGTSPRTGFDCSGFVKYIFAKFDIFVPRTSYAQAAALPAIPRRDLKPGDLVFFNTMHRAFSHVGIYIGKGKFVSAQTPATGVQVASLSDPYWAARFDGARRLPHGVSLS